MKLMCPKIDCRAPECCILDHYIVLALKFDILVESTDVTWGKVLQASSQRGGGAQPSGLDSNRVPLGKNDTSMGCNELQLRFKDQEEIQTYPLNANLHLLPGVSKKEVVALSAVAGDGFDRDKT